ncbi:MAG: hypothetical protein R3Y28_05250 [Candidatus Gastranaerophilales bacterium]
MVADDNKFSSRFSEQKCVEQFEPSELIELHEDLNDVEVDNKIVTSENSELSLNVIVDTDEVEELEIVKEVMVEVEAEKNDEIITIEDRIIPCASAVVLLKPELENLLNMKISQTPVWQDFSVLMRKDLISKFLYKKLELNNTLSEEEKSFVIDEIIASRGL